MLYAEEVDALAEATAVDVTEEGRVELWQFCRAATGLDGEALSSVLSNLDKEDADMLSALRAIRVQPGSQTKWRKWCEPCSAG